VIAIVDDDDSVRSATKALLESVGFQVATFDSAELFFGSGALSQTECLILDVRMPGMNGLKLQRRLRASGSVIPVIFISAHDDRKQRSDALAAGAAGFLTKPFVAADLLATIRSVTLGRAAE
jgi:FixJ family two-component response regulator